MNMKNEKTKIKRQSWILEKVNKPVVNLKKWTQLKQK